MSFVKTLINTNGTLANPLDMDTITLRNNAINTALLPYDTIALRQSNIISSLLPYDLISQRIAAISSAFNGFLTTNNLYIGTNSFFNTIIRGSLAKSSISINSTITLSASPLCNYFCVNGINNIIITLSSAIDQGCQVFIRRGASSSSSITISHPSLFGHNSNVSVTSILLNNSCEFIFFENAWYQKSNF